MDQLYGIDYGSKLAGTTVIASYTPQSNSFEIKCSGKKKDADKFILDNCSAATNTILSIDAPLSLPGRLVYGEPYSDYFYRKADKDLKAMSPMFLGGLTARAIRVKDILESKKIRVYESYPARIAKELNLSALNYKKEKIHIKEVYKVLVQELPFLDPGDIPVDWHHVDALLCLRTSLKIYAEKANSIGDKKEGLIWY